MDILQKVAEDIISLKIQGATNVAIDGVNAFSSYIHRLETSLGLEEFAKKIDEARDMLINTRPTEPAMRNGLKKILYDMNSVRNDGVEAMKEKAINSAQDYVKLIKDTKEKIIQTGFQRIQDGYTVMTHCHSST
ncbi:MAG: hypothetical protein ACW99Q_13325, partial [Candidatus Kariarchaeaceae archaeon]